MKPIEIIITINGKPIEDYSEKELEVIRRKLTYKAMRAAGYVPVDKRADV